MATLERPDLKPDHLNLPHNSFYPEINPVRFTLKILGHTFMRMED